MSEQNLVSVVIPTKNSARTIETCLKSVKEQTYRNIEIIIVNSFSRDKTKKIAEDFGARIIEIDAKRSEARNIGAERAKGESIIFIDSDMELDSNVIEECVNKIREGYDAVIIPEISVGEGFWVRCKALEKLCYIGDDLIEASRFFRKKLFRSIGGYDGELEAGEDWDINQRIKCDGFKIGRINAFIKHHEGRLSLLESMLKKHCYGKTLRQYKRKHPIEARQQLRLIRSPFVKHWRKLAGDPIHAFGMFFMKVCEFGAGWLGFLEARMNHDES